MSPSLLSRRLPLAAPAVQHEVLGRLPLACDFDESVERAGQWPLRSEEIEIFQINVGKLCNMTCRHCHVDAGPDRTAEMMSRETVDLCLAALDQTEAKTVDIRPFGLRRFAEGRPLEGPYPYAPRADHGAPAGVAALEW